MTGRGNGLSAGSWAPIADLDTLLVAPLLDALADVGIAAYAEPSHGRQGAYLEVRWHDRPTDRLYVDAAVTADARSLLEATLPALRADLEQRLTPEPPPSHTAAPPASPTAASSASSAAPASAAAGRTDDDVWAQLVASFAETPTPRPGERPPWPAAEDVDTAAPRRAPRLLRPAADGAAAGAAADAYGRAEAVRPAPPDPTDHYVPPEPPPLPRLDLVTRLAWAATVGGPLLLLVVALLRDVLPTSVAALPVLAFVAGFVTLVARMRDRPSDLDGPDDGAVV
ncbi:MAG: hypothetical protein ACTHK1_09870 [Actinomycetales bacterium]